MSQTVTGIFESCLENTLVENWVLTDNSLRLLMLGSGEHEVLESNSCLALLVKVNILLHFLAQVN